MAPCLASSLLVSCYSNAFQANTQAVSFRYSKLSKSIKSESTIEGLIVIILSMINNYR